MNRKKWLAAALLAVPVVIGGGLAYASTQKAEGYTCPVTGENLPCEKCCPLNGETRQVAATEAKAGGPEPSASEADYICPITGEKLGCPNCCPLTKAK
jgi:hypothetical protein